MSLEDELARRQQADTDAAKRESKLLAERRNMHEGRRAELAKLRDLLIDASVSTSPIIVRAAYFEDFDPDQLAEALAAGRVDQLGRLTWWSKYEATLVAEEQPNAQQPPELTLRGRFGRERSMTHQLTLPVPGPPPPSNQREPRCSVETEIWWFEESWAEWPDVWEHLPNTNAHSSDSLPHKNFMPVRWGLTNSLEVMLEVGEINTYYRPPDQWRPQQRQPDHARQPWKIRVVSMLPFFGCIPIGALADVVEQHDLDWSNPLTKESASIVEPVRHLVYTREAGWFHAASDPKTIARWWTGYEWTSTVVPVVDLGQTVGD